MQKPLSGIRIPVLLFIAILIGTACSKNSDTTAWLAKEGPLMTRWSAELAPGKTWTEYPRPQMKRSNWKNLNGLWDYAITSAEAKMPTGWQGKILVPYPIESALSGVMKRVTGADKIWYHRELRLNTKMRSHRILLNFEASDWETHVYIDGLLVGTHRGGYDPFSFDISENITAGEKHSLVVSVRDASTESYQPVGKQTNNPGGIWYTPSSGIWQTVWIEQVPKAYIRSYTAIPDIDNGTVTVRIEGENLRSSDDLEIRVFKNHKLVGTEKADADEEATLSLDDVRLWSPEDPFLYDLEVRILRRSSVLDQVKGYFGMRKISIGKDDKGITRILLNNRFVFQNGPLDQGFWPDGLNTAPSEEAMVYDLEMTKKMGFNMLRKHVKVEPRRFYYHTDRMGILVWQDMPSMFYGVFELPAFKDSLEVIKANFETELTELVQEHINSPSIIMWVPFNEGWGQYDTERIAAYVKTLDPTRLVNNASGWTDKGAGDVMDIHHYPEPAAPPAEENRAIVLGEFGGLGLMTPGHMWKEENWGYEKMQDVNSLLEKYENFYLEVARLVENPGLSAVIYTQTTDVETETNGLMTYDRDRVKMGAENVAKAHSGKIAPRLVSGVRQFTDDYWVEFVSPPGGASIHFTTDGSNPDKNSNAYTKPVTLLSSMILKAKSFWPDGDTSRTATYEISKVVPAPAVQADVKPGLRVSIYRGNWNTLPDFETLTPESRKTAAKIDVSPAASNELFGLVFEGYLDVPASGVYQIFLSSDDGGRISLDGKTLIDYDGIHGAGEMSAPAPLQKGLHPFKLIYFQRKGGLGLKLSWEGPGIEKEEIQPGYYKVGK